MGRLRKSKSRTPEGKDDSPEAGDPYFPRPRYRLRAPKGKYRVLGVDTFEGPFADYLIGDYYSLSGAKKAAKREAGEMNPVYVYNDEGRLVFEAGSK